MPASDSPLADGNASGVILNTDAMRGQFGGLAGDGVRRYGNASQAINSYRDIHRNTDDDGTVADVGTTDTIYRASCVRVVELDQRGESCRAIVDGSCKRFRSQSQPVRAVRGRANWKLEQAAVSRLLNS